MCTSLRPSTYVMGSKVNLGSFGVTGVKRSFSPKMLFLTDYMAWLCNSLNKYISLRPSIPFMGTRSTWGSLPPANIMRLCPDLFPDLVTQSQSATVSFICTISYTVAVCDCVFLLYDFFLLLLLLLSTLQSLISPTWLDRFWPDLVTSTGWPSHLCDITKLGSKVT